MATDMTKALRFDLKRLKGNLYQIQVEHNKQIPDYLLKEMIEVESTIANLEMCGYLDIPKEV